MVAAICIGLVVVALDCLFAFQSGWPTNVTQKEQALSDDLPASPAPDADTSGPQDQAIAEAADRGSVFPTKSPFRTGPWDKNHRCISPEMATNPRRHAFPANPEAQCRVNSFTTADGRYRAEMICNTALKENTRMSFGGNYDHTSFVINLTNNLPASALTGDSNDTQIIIAHFRFDGTRTGPC